MSKSHSDQEPYNRYASLRSFIDKDLSNYYDKLLSGDIDLIQLLEQHMTTDAIDRALPRMEAAHEVEKY